MYFHRKLGPELSLPPQPLVSPTLQSSSEGSEGTPLRRAGNEQPADLTLCNKQDNIFNIASINLSSQLGNVVCLCLIWYDECN